MIAAVRCPQCGGSLPPSQGGYTVCQYCGSSLIWSHPGAQPGAAAAATAGAAAAAGETVTRGMRLRQFTYTDTQGTGLEAFRLLVPVGWEFRGGITWLMDNPGMPAVAAFQVANPQGAEAFEVLPNINLSWNDSPMTRMLFPIGSRYFGSEVRPPMNAQEALRKIVLPRYRNVPGLQVVSLEAQPDLPRLVRAEAPVSGGAADGAKARVRYTLQGVPLEEELYAVVEVFRLPIQSLFASEFVTWFIDYILAFRAAAGRLDATANLFTVMSGSFQANPQWLATFKAISTRLCQQQIQQIHNIGQISRMVAQMSDQLREQNLRDWYARQEVYDRLGTDWSRAIRDVDGFYDPHREQVVELPSGYGHAWANNLGEYVITEDPNFNPNIGSNLHWEPMEKQ